MPASAQQIRRVAVVGASTLRGRELKELLEGSSLPVSDVRLLDDEIADGLLTEAGGEPVVIHSVDEESFEGVEFAFFAGAPEFTAQHWPEANRSGATVIDLSGALAEVPAAVVWIPALDAVLPPPQPPVGKLFLSPGAAAIVACTISAALARFSVERLVIVFFQPVSERGEPGIEELESQTVNLLSFQPISQQLYDAQVAFNLLAGYGDASHERLADLRAGLARRVAAYLAGRAPVPAIQLVHAPVFYSYAFTAFAELSRAVEAEEIERVLASAGIQMQAAGEPAPSNVSVAGESRVALARIERDPNLGAGYWLWGAADNVRLTVHNALAIAEKILAP